MSDLLKLTDKLAFEKRHLRTFLPDVESALFFSKLYKLTPEERSSLLLFLFEKSDVIAALLAEGGEHSTELQDYLIEEGYESEVVDGDIAIDPDRPAGEILPEMWKDLEVEVAKSIQDVAEKLGDVVGAMPGKSGQMMFKSMQMLNARRPIPMDHKAVIQHTHQVDNLVILDCSASVSKPTIKRLVDEVVALAWEANAHLAIVSNTATHWAPGEYSVDEVLAAAEYGGTYYEELAPLFDREWGVVVTIADYDSAATAKYRFGECKGNVQQVLDISLVSRPTFLSECVGVVAKDVRPLLVAADDYRCMY